MLDELAEHYSEILAYGLFITSGEGGAEVPAGGCTPPGGVDGGDPGL